MPFKDAQQAKSYKRSYYLAHIEVARQRRRDRREIINSQKRDRYHRTKVLKNSWRLCPERLMERVRVTESGCWEWQGRGRSRYGHARVQVNGFHKPAHRAVYEMLRGSVDPTVEVCHQCDNAICVNPDHMFLGTQADNMRDMVQKNRQAKGERVATAKLTESLVRQIRAEYVPWEMGSHRLAKKYGVSKCTVTRILKHQIWKHVEEVPNGHHS